ncbi:MAG TPA: putative toxin-antitoxin system toxin component, PIN family [Methylomirabilota bacterium]|nr:putative toxin-antitoxin system toxin component, PIN family [Methylomirabilota bacterium]
MLLDTNQLISSLVSTRGPQRELVDAWRRRAFLLLLTAEQLEEVREVLGRPKIARKYRISPADRQAFLDLLRAEVILLPDEPAPGVCRDPDDDHLLGCAAAGGVEYLVTGDRDLLSVRRFRETSIVDARAFLGLLST